MVTKVRVVVALSGLVMILAGCGDGGVSGFTGGTSSKDKQPIPPAVNAAAGVGVAHAATPDASPSMEGPAATSKAPETMDVDDVDSESPIRSQSMQYRADRMRDPFLSLIGDSEGFGELVDLSVVTLVGVVLGEKPFAVVENAEGISYVLHEGDRVKNGRVVEIREEGIKCSQTVLGYTTTVQLKLEEQKKVGTTGKGGKNVG